MARYHYGHADRQRRLAAVCAYLRARFENVERWPVTPEMIAEYDAQQRRRYRRKATASTTATRIDSGGGGGAMIDNAA